MTKNYKLLTENVRNRINPDHLVLKKAFTDELSTLSYSDVLVYVRLAMKGVELEYTSISVDAGNKVKDHLSRLSDVVFKFQGSVMTNTHIKGHSDIDLLVISDKFYSYDSFGIDEVLTRPEKRSQFLTESINKMQREKDIPSYTGNCISDLRLIRMQSEGILQDIYTICDISNPKSIKLKNLSNNRKVDVVVANWYDDITSVINNKGDYRGIQIFNKDSNSKEKTDYPFLSIKRINERSIYTTGRLKKMIRFLKHTKANSTLPIDLSSFDINAICYDIDPSKYLNVSSLDLVPILYNQLRTVCTSTAYSDNIISVDGREYIFRNNPGKIQSLKYLLSEVEGVYNDLKSNLIKS